MDETELFFRDTSKEMFHVKGNITFLLSPLFWFGLYFLLSKEINLDSLVLKSKVENKPMIKSKRYPNATRKVNVLLFL